MIASHPRRLASLACFFAALAVGTAAAQPLQPNANPADQPETVRDALVARLTSIQQEMKSLDDQLQTIQRSALQANPELVERQEDFEDLVFSAMSDQGFDATEAIDRMRDMQTQLQAGTLAPEAQQAMSRELQQQGEAFQAAQGAAMQTPDVQVRLNELESELLAAMVEVDPRAEGLVAELSAKQRDFQQLLAAIRRQ